MPKNRASDEKSSSSRRIGQQLPEEFRAGLDEYFNRLEVK